MATVKLDGVKKVYDNTVTAVQSFDLEIADKEFIVLVGPSGCGKSTTLRMIAGLEDITEGDLYIDDLRVNDVAPKDRDIAMVFQSYALYPHMTVYDNMAFALKLRKMDRNEIDKRVREAAEILHTEYLNASPRPCPAVSASAWPSAARSSVNPVFLMDELCQTSTQSCNQMRAEIINCVSASTTTLYMSHTTDRSNDSGIVLLAMKDG